MEREAPTTSVLAIQRCMADATPRSWRDGIVLRTEAGTIEVGLLDGDVLRLRVVGPAVELVSGEPVAYHPVAEILAAGRLETTARAAI